MVLYVSGFIRELSQICQVAEGGVSEVIVKDHHKRPSKGLKYVKLSVT